MEELILQIAFAFCATFATCVFIELFLSVKDNKQQEEERKSKDVFCLLEEASDIEVLAQNSDTYYLSLKNKGMLAHVEFVPGDPMRSVIYEYILNSEEVHSPFTIPPKTYQNIASALGIGD